MLRESWTQSGNSGDDFGLLNNLYIMMKREIRIYDNFNKTQIVDDGGRIYCQDLRTNYNR